MLIPKPNDAIHKLWLLRLLTAIADHPQLGQIFYFKGGTCAAMRGWLDRFSVDLDFDLRIDKEELPKMRKELEKIFLNLELNIKDSSKNTIQYFLKYKNDKGDRNTIKLDALIPPPKSNKYEQVNLADIDRTMWCQTKETMFANKLVALIDRYKKTGQIAGRDLYDIHVFFLKGFNYEGKVIEERTNKKAKDFLKELIIFIEKNITQTIINQDLNFLLPDKEFQQIRKTLKTEAIMLIRDEIKRL